MKKITLLLTLIIGLLSLQLQAQEGYSYTLVDNGGYSYTIEAVPNPSTSNFPPSVQSYGFTIILPDGITATITGSFGPAANATFFNGSDVSMPSIDGYLITETLGSPLNLPAPSAGTNTAMVTIQLAGAPTSGEIYILANNSTLASIVTPLKAFLQADTTDDSTFNFTNVIDEFNSGLSGTVSYDFATLSVDDQELQPNQVVLYPIPAQKTININSATPVSSYNLYDLSGKLIHNDTPVKNSQIDISELAAGAYILNLKLDNDFIVTKEIIKN